MAAGGAGNAWLSARTSSCRCDVLLGASASQLALFPFEAMQQVDDDVPNAREVVIECLGGCWLAEGVFKDVA